MTDRWLVEETVTRRDAETTWEMVVAPRVLDGRPGVVFRKRRTFWDRIALGPIRDVFKGFKEWISLGGMEQAEYAETEFGANFKVQGTGSITQRNV